MLLQTARVEAVSNKPRLCASADVVLPAPGVYLRIKDGWTMLSFVKDDDPDVLHFAAAILLFDGRSNEAAFELMQTEGAFPRIVELVRVQQDNDSGLHRLLLELMFEMSQMQKLGREDLGELTLAKKQLLILTYAVTVDDGFVLHLFQLIEELSDDVDDPYHYHIIRVLVRLQIPFLCSNGLILDSLYSTNNTFVLRTPRYRRTPQSPSRIGS